MHTPMEQLPDELCLHILRYVSLEDLTFRCSATSRALRRISDDADLWHHHLYQYHPRWRDALQDMGVDATVTPLRECVRRLTEAHYPDGVSGCCKHDLTKGAACTCCTCRRHHRQRWQWGVLSSLVNDMTNSEMRQMIAAAYDANAATPVQLIEYNDELRRQRRQRRRRRRRRLQRGPGRRRRRGGGGGGSGGGSSDDDDDDDRRRELITELERMGILELRNKGSRLESVRWTEAAHRDLRPPLQRGLVCYSDAELYTNLMRYHPELCDDTGLLERCGEGTKSVDEIHSKTVNYRRAFSFGGATTPAAAPSTGNLFGPTVPSTSLFGATTSTGTSRSSLFGGGHTSSLFGGAGTSTTSTSLYGAPATSTGIIGGSSFGSTPSTPSATTSSFPSLGGFGAGTTSTFGAPATSTGSSLFGRATTGGAGSGVFPGFSSTTPGASSSLGMDGVTK